MRRVPRGLVALGLAAAGLGACESAVQRQRLATCRRAVPAVAPEDGPVTIVRAGTGAPPDSIRVDYAAGPHRHWALCRFNAGAILTGLSTDRTTLPDASLYLLKRYYLDTPEAESADPGRP